MDAAAPVGVLALQGAFAAHEQRLAELGVTTRQVRTPADLAAVRAAGKSRRSSSTSTSLVVRTAAGSTVATHRATA